jgi:CoA:oxalate CoA-transferase
MAAFSITTALVVRESTGRGQRVDISLLNSLMYSSSIGLLEFEGQTKLPFDDPQGVMPLYKFYQASDGQWLFLGLGNFTFFTKFAVLMEHHEWLVNPLFEGAPFLIFPPRNTQVIAMFKEIFATKTRDEWIELLRSEDIPCAPAQTVEKFLDDPQVLANEMVVEMEQPGLGKVRQMGVPVRLSQFPGRIKCPSPEQGEHTEEVLADLLGYSGKEIAGLKKKQIC